MNRILRFHCHETSGNTVRLAPSAYYMDADYDKVAVRLYAEKAPLRDAKFNIYDDGVSIFSNQTFKKYNYSSGVDETGADKYEVSLPKGQNSEEIAETFNSTQIEEGSWVWCNMVDAGDGKNFTVQLELHQVSEDVQEID